MRVVITFCDMSSSRIDKMIERFSMTKPDVCWGMGIMAATINPDDLQDIRNYDDVKEVDTRFDFKKFAGE